MGDLDDLANAAHAPASPARSTAMRASPPPPPPPPKQGWTRNPAIVGGIFVALVLVGGLIAWAVINSQQASGLARREAEEAQATQRAAAERLDEERSRRIAAQHAGVFDFTEQDAAKRRAAAATQTASTQQVAGKTVQDVLSLKAYKPDGRHVNFVAENRGERAIVNVVVEVRNPADKQPTHPPFSFKIARIPRHGKIESTVDDDDFIMIDDPKLVATEGAFEVAP